MNCSKKAKFVYLFATVFLYWPMHLKCRIKETLNFSMCADSSTDTKKIQKIVKKIKKKTQYICICHVSYITCHVSPVTCHL